MSRFLAKRFQGMSPYVPGEQPQNRRYIKLNTNESPFPPSPGVISALDAGAAGSLNLYPDPDARGATEAVSRYHGLSPDTVLLGNGSDEILYFCFQAFCGEDTPACFADVTYGFYPVFAQVLCLPTQIFPLNPNFEVDVDAYAKACGTVFIANPNAPTGLSLPLADIERILCSRPDNVVVVDEAYIDFGGESAIALIGCYENLIVVRTMSKSRNLAGARIGYAMAQKPLIDDLRRMKFSLNPYNVNRLSLLAAEASVKDEQYFRQCVETIIKTREFTVSGLRRRGFEVIPSSTNFVFARSSKLSGEEYYLHLMEQGILVRHFAGERTAGYVRITIGSLEQMKALLKATDEIMEGL